MSFELPQEFDKAKSTSMGPIQEGVTRLTIGVDALIFGSDLGTTCLAALVLRLGRAAEVPKTSKQLSSSASIFSLQLTYVTLPPVALCKEESCFLKTGNEPVPYLCDEKDMIKGKCDSHLRKKSLAGHVTSR